jgi:hypothetical protein
MHSPSISVSLPQKPFVIEDSVCPHLGPMVIQKYQNNESINKFLQLVPKLLLSERSLMILRECDQANDSKNDIKQHIIEGIKEVEITVDNTKSRYYPTDGTYILQINKELFEDCVNALDQPLVSNQAQFRFLISVCHEFVHHKLHKYLLNDKWGTTKDEITPPELRESGFYWEDEVVGGRIIKQDKNIYSFRPKGQATIKLDEDLCLFLLDKENYNNENINVYSRKEKQQQQQQLPSESSAKRPRRKIQHLYINLCGTEKIKKTKTESNKRYRLTPNNPLFAEITLVNDATGPIIYSDLPQNCGGLHSYLYKYNEDDGEMFTVDLPVNENDWTCSALRQRFRAIPFIIPDNVIINPHESKTFTIKLMEITTDNEEENLKTGHYYLEIVMGYYIEETDSHYADERTIEFDVEYDNGKNNDENINDSQDDMPILKD